jgi:hypothetical protein
MKRHWPCFLLLILTALDFFIPDPLPILDEALLAGMTALCFGKRGKGPPSS